MKAMIFAAGLGTRLKPLTNNIPKALVPLREKPLLQHTIEYLAKHGIREIIINVHHHADKVIHFLNTHPWDVRIEVSDEREELLDTGGGLKKASWFFDDDQPFFIVNTDIITTLDLEKMMQFHLSAQGNVTLAVRKEYRSRHLLLDDGMRLCGKGDDAGHKKHLIVSAKHTHKYRFSGVHLINPEVFAYFPHTGRFPVMAWYMELIKHQVIVGYDHSDDFWMDLGRPENLVAAENLYHRFFKS